jgi:hypothetical protein
VSIGDNFTGARKAKGKTTEKPNDKALLAHFW